MQAIVKRKGLERGSKRGVGLERDAENSPPLSHLESLTCGRLARMELRTSELSASTNWTIFEKKSSALQAVKYVEVRTKPLICEKRIFRIH